MQTLTEEQIREISEHIDFGFCAFWHKLTSELLFIPDFVNNQFADASFYKDEIKKLDNNIGNYIEIERPNSSDMFEIMADFTEQLLDNEKLKNNLIIALQKKKPFREFKFIIDNSGVHRQQWFDFKNANLRKWVTDKFNEATYSEQENGNT